MHAPGGGQCGTQGWSLFRVEVAMLSYPLKTSLVSCQVFGSLPFAVNAGFQVAFTRFENDLFCLTLDAMMLSCVRQVLIICNQRFLISLLE